MRAQIVTKGEMATDITHVAFFKDVHLVRALIASLAQITPAGNAELTHIFISVLGKLPRLEAYIGKALDYGHDVNHGLSHKPRHRRAANVVNGDTVSTEYPADDSSLAFKHTLPFRVVFYDSQMLGHNEND